MDESVSRRTDYLFNIRRVEFRVSFGTYWVFSRMGSKGAVKVGLDKLSIACTSYLLSSHTSAFPALLSLLFLALDPYRPLG